MALLTVLVRFAMNMLHIIPMCVSSTKKMEVCRQPAMPASKWLKANTLPVLMARLEAHPDYDILEYPVYWHHGGKDAVVMKFGVNTYDDMREYWLRGKAYNHS